MKKVKFKKKLKSFGPVYEWVSCTEKYIVKPQEEIAAEVLKIRMFRFGIAVGTLILVAIITKLIIN